MKALFWLPIITLAIVAGPFIGIIAALLEEAVKVTYKQLK